MREARPSRFAKYVLNRAGLSGATYPDLTMPQLQFEGKPSEVDVIVRILQSSLHLKELAR